MTISTLSFFLSKADSIVSDQVGIGPYSLLIRTTVKIKANTNKMNLNAFILKLEINECLFFKDAERKDQECHKVNRNVLHVHESNGCFGKVFKEIFSKE